MNPCNRIFEKKIYLLRPDLYVRLSSALFLVKKAIYGTYDYKNVSLMLINLLPFDSDSC